MTWEPFNNVKLLSALDDYFALHGVKRWQGLPKKATSKLAESTEVLGISTLDRGPGMLRRGSAWAPTRINKYKRRSREATVGLQMTLSDTDSNSNNKSSSERSRPEAENSMEVDMTVAPSSSTAPPVAVSKSDAVNAERVHGETIAGSVGKIVRGLAHAITRGWRTQNSGHLCNDGVFGCLDCREYVWHIVAAFHDDDADIRNVINKQDDIIASNRRTREEARLRGELAITERTLEDANNKIEDLTRQVIELSTKWFWPRMTRPTITDPDAAAAAWYQRQGLIPEYCPYMDDFHTLNARLFRGFRTWSVITGCPRRGMATADLAADDPVLAICKAVLHMLLVPDSYRKICVLTGIPSNPRKSSHFGLGSDVSQPTSAMGNYRKVSQIWVFNLIASTSCVGWDVEVLKNTITACDEGIAAHGHAPPGKKLPYGAYLFHPPGFPWADKLLNGIQEKVVFLMDIPVPAPFGSNKLGRFNFIDASANSSSPARASSSSRGSSSRGRGGSNVGQGRGSAPRARGRGGYAAAAGLLAWNTTLRVVVQWRIVDPASHALQQQYNTATLFASPDAGFPYSSTSSSATPTTVSNAPAGFHGGNGTIPTQFSNLGLDYLGSSPNLQFPPH
ncbi:hypothetical protein C8R45DRAFT_947984 [Mycena sanguinolenta]|nr:hypothetical protein C8R45DRAFT_947984 [Mycena sanguinolenta]